MENDVAVIICNSEGDFIQRGHFDCYPWGKMLKGKGKKVILDLTTVPKNPMVVQPPKQSGFVLADASLITIFAATIQFLVLTP